MYYQAPLYRVLAQRPEVDFTAVFMSTGGVRPAEAGYSKPIAWDVPILGGYEHRFLAQADEAGILGSSDPSVVPALRELDPDVVWIHGYTSGTHVFAATWARLMGRGVMLREEQTLLHEQSRSRWLLKDAFFRTVFRRGAAVAIGANNREWLHRAGFTDDRIVLGRYCVENERFSLNPEQRQCLREEYRDELGIAKDRVVVSGMFRMIPKKQPLHLVRAFELARREVPELSLLLAGDGELLGQVSAYIESAGLPDVHVAGFVNQSRAAAVYAASDVFALPSAYHETWGLVVNEAMAAGLPVVVSDKVGSARDLVVGQGSGIVVPHDSVDALAGALVRLGRDAGERAEMGARAAEVVAGFTYEAAAEAVVGAARIAARLARPRGTT
jgi:glycosyltransferase involved in cell wall biosynthesis